MPFFHAPAMPVRFPDLLAQGQIQFGQITLGFHQDQWPFLNRHRSRALAGYVHHSCLSRNGGLHGGNTRWVRVDPLQTRG